MFVMNATPELVEGLRSEGVLWEIEFLYTDPRSTEFWESHSGILDGVSSLQWFEQQPEIEP